MTIYGIGLDEDTFKVTKGVKKIKVYSYEYSIRPITKDSMYLSNILEFYPNGEMKTQLMYFSEKLIKTISFVYHDSYKEVNEKDDNGKLVYSASYYNKLISKSIQYTKDKQIMTTYSYENKDKLKKKVITDTSGTTTNWEYHYDYYKNGKIKSVFINNKLNESFEYKTDSIESVNIITQKEFKNDSLNEILVFHYWFNGRLSEFHQIVFSNSIHTWKEYFYDEQNRLIREENYSDNETKKYFYDNENLIEYQFYENGCLKEGSIYEYEFFDKNSK